jgi:hypothetical protein
VVSTKREDDDAAGEKYIKEEMDVLNVARANAFWNGRDLSVLPPLPGAVLRWTQKSRSRARRHVQTHYHYRPDL